jgi:hypothetical protein
MKQTPEYLRKVVFDIGRVQIAVRRRRPVTPHQTLRPC